MKRSPRLVTVALLVACGSVVFLAGLAAAQARACVDDAKKFCQGVAPRGGKLAQCLKAHEADLSAACKEHIQAAQAGVQGFRQACQGEMAKLCPNIAPGSRRMAQCLKQHSTELSAECQAELSQLGQRAKPTQ